MDDPATEEGSETYLRLAISYYNRSRNGLAAELKLEAMDNITKSQFLCIVNMLMSNLKADDGPSEVKTVYSLSNLNDILGTSSLEFNASAEAAYSSLKKILPPGCAHIGVFYFPNFYKVEAKEIIATLTALIMFYDSVVDNFDREWNDFHDENTLKKNLTREIEDLKTAIGERIGIKKKMMEELKEEERKIQELDSPIRKELSIKAELESEAMKYQVEYDEAVQSKASLEQDLEYITEEIWNYEQQIVANGQATEDALRKEEAAFIQATKERDELSLRSEQMALTEDKLNSAISCVNKTMESIEKCRNLLLSSSEIVRNVAEKESCCNRSKHKLQHQEEVNFKLKKDLTSVKREKQIKEERYVSKHQSLSSKIKASLGTLEETKRRKNELTVRHLELISIENDENDEIERYENSVMECKKEIKSLEAEYDLFDAEFAKFVDEQLNKLQESLPFPKPSDHLE